MNPRHQRPYFGALDLGTNNCRLLVAQPVRDGFRVVDAFSRIVRLGEGLAQTGRLSDAAMDRTIGALRVCARKIARYRNIRVRCVATEACRRASNYAQFMDRVREETGLDLEVISTEEEALLALEGCLPLMVPGRRNALVFDIGGGSTEIAWRRDDGEGVSVSSTSIPVGVVNFAERCGADTYSRDRYESMVDEMKSAFMGFEAHAGILGEIEAGTVQMIGTSGTVTTLASVHLNLERYDRRVVDGCFLDFEDISRAADRVRRLTNEQRLRLGCIGRGRADLVVPGVAILEAICELWPVGRLRVADRGLREGILLGMMADRGRRTQAPPLGGRG